VHSLTYLSRRSAGVAGTSTGAALRAVAFGVCPRACIDSRVRARSDACSSRSFDFGRLRGAGDGERRVCDGCFGVVQRFLEAAYAR
jgi:hypothetical protein